MQDDANIQLFLARLLSPSHDADQETDEPCEFEWSWPDNIGEEARVCMLSHGFAAKTGADHSSRLKLGRLNLEEQRAVIEASQKLIRHSEFESAEQLLTLAILASSDPRLLIAELARGYEKANQPYKTLKATSLLSADFPHFWEIRFLHALALRAVGRSDEALEVILPDLINAPSSSLKRLYGILLSDIGAHLDAIGVFQSILAEDREDYETARVLANKYIQIADYDRALDLISAIKTRSRKLIDDVQECLILRNLGELSESIGIANKVIKADATNRDGYWVQCFNYGISAAKYTKSLLCQSEIFWKLHREELNITCCPRALEPHSPDQRIRVGILSADIGDHVVARFIRPILRSYDRGKLQIEILCTTRRYDELAEGFKELCSEIISLQGLDSSAANQLMISRKYDIIVETGGLTNNSGLSLLAQRCAPIQCHYIGYHATTGLNTIDFFLGDKITCSYDLQNQFREEILQLPIPWIRYDNEIAFPDAYSTSMREGPVLGCFCQISKIGSETLRFWAEALHACPDAILVIKDRGTTSQRFRLRIEEYLSREDIKLSRLFYVGPVASHLEHLSCYNAIDIAIDTAPWSSATTAFEALGMGVPIVAIYGDTTSGRMSASVATAAGMPNLVSRNPGDFSRIIHMLAKEYKDIRRSKPYLQKAIREGSLFDDRMAGISFYEAVKCMISKLINH